MAKATDENWFGVYTNLAQAQDWWLSNNATTGKVDVQMYATGGIGEMFFMFGANPDAVTLQYHKAIAGAPVLSPRWALGWHHCRYGYNDTDALALNIMYYDLHNIPLDTRWVDIDYLESYKNFVLEDSTFGDLPDFVNK